MYETPKTISSEERHTSRFYFVQPIHSRLILNVDNPECEYFNAKYLSYSSNPVTQTNPQSKPKFTKVCEFCVNPVFQTNKGYEVCPCGKTTEDLVHSVKETPPQQQSTKLELEDNSKQQKPTQRSFSCDGNDENYRKDNRRVSILVDELLLKIYGGNRKFSSDGTDFRDTIDSTDSSNSFVSVKSNVLLKKRRSFAGITQDMYLKWNAFIRARLMSKSLSELKILKKTLEYNISHAGRQLICQLKRRDLLFSRRDAQYDILTAFLQAKSPKRISSPVPLESCSPCLPTNFRRSDIITCVEGFVKG